VPQLFQFQKLKQANYIPQKMHRFRPYGQQVRRRRFQRDSTEKTNTLPPLYDYLNKQVFIHLKSGNRRVSGTLAGFDVFQNLTLKDAVDESTPGVKSELSEIVRCVPEG
jgi:small nuclear ribonucleoprotein (snRNP)-like protein